MSMYKALPDDDKSRLEKRGQNGESLEDWQESRLRLVHILFTIFCVISGVVAFIVVGTSPASSTLKLLVSTAYRDKATIDSDFYPEITFDLSRTINLGYVAAAISLGGAISHIIGWIWFGQQIQQMTRGLNPYLWAGFFFWHPIIFILVGSLAGITDVYLLSFIALSVIAWVFLLWNADQLNSFAYQLLLHKSGAAAWNWLNTAFVFFVALATYIMITIIAFQTFGADAFAANNITAGWYIGLLITIGLLYLVNPFIFVAWKAQWIGTMYTREMVFHAFNGVMAILVTWVTIGFFLADSVTLP